MFVVCKVWVAVLRVLDEIGPDEVIISRERELLASKIIIKNVKQFLLTNKLTHKQKHATNKKIGADKVIISREQRLEGGAIGFQDDK